MLCLSGLNFLHVRSLSNNNLQVLPRDLFNHLDILTDLYVPDSQIFPCEGLLLKQAVSFHVYRPIYAVCEK